MKGFSLLETLIAVTIFSTISVAVVYMLFLSLNLRDTTLAVTRIEESLRIFDRSLRQATLNATSVTGGGGSIFMRSTAECWSFVYDTTAKNVKYAKISQAGCSPESNPTELFFPTATQITGLNFSLFPLSTGGRQISVSGTVQNILPFGVYQMSFANTYTNLID